MRIRLFSLLGIAEHSVNGRPADPKLINHVIWPDPGFPEFDQLSNVPEQCRSLNKSSPRNQDHKI